MHKGIVMELTDSHIVVMRSDGKFERISRKKRSCEIGEEIIYASSGVNWRSPSVAGRSAIAAAVIFCLVLFASFTGKLGSPEVVAYISMDINPSVEMGIDIEENVLELRGLNADGIQLIEKVDFKGKQLEQVTDQLLDKAETKILSRGEAEIVIASTVVKPDANIDDTAIAQKVKREVNKYMQLVHPQNASMFQVTAFAAPKEVREAAAQNGLSAGKYTLYLNAKNSGTDVTLDELKKESVLQILKKKPEMAKILQSDHVLSKTELTKLVQDEKSGELDKKLQEMKKGNKGINESAGNKDKNDNGSNRSKIEGPEKKDSTPAGGKVESKDDSQKAGSTKGSPNGKPANKEDAGDKKPASSVKPGTSGGTGSVRSGEQQNDKKTEAQQDDRKKNDDQAQENAKKEQEARRLDELKKKAEEQQQKVEEEQKSKQQGDSKKSDESKRDGGTRNDDKGKASGNDKN